MELDHVERRAIWMMIFGLAIIIGFLAAAIDWKPHVIQKTQQRKGR